jgi:hypothetical protein
VPDNSKALPARSPLDLLVDVPDATLRRDSVRAGWKHLGQDCNRKPGVCELQRTTHAGTAGPHDHHIKLTAR